ncbi:MAG: mechanosensitive ion channel [Pseudobacteriovorax sp.]|nr:mechanosensitive ion channel [Pseudobacteriovorax sp.]
MNIDSFLTEERLASLVTLGGKAIVAVAIFVAAILVSKWIDKLIRKALQRAKVDTTLSRFFGSLARYAIITMTVISILGSFGVQTASFAAVIASVSFALGLALQGSLGNFASGIMLLLFRPFSVGDFIRAAGETGSVTHIDFLTTALDTPDNRRIIIPNSQVFGSTIENVTFNQARRCDVAVGTAYESDVDETRKVLEAVIANYKGRIKDKESVVVLTGLGASSVDWALRVWVDKADYWTVREELLRLVKYELDKAKIGIPFPQMDVHIQK